MIRFLAILLFAAALVGCGSSSTTATTSSTPVTTKARFLAKAGAICTAAKAALAPVRADVKSLTLKSPTPARLHELNALLRRNAAITRATFEKLEALAKQEGLAQADGMKACDRSK
jgi:hypothetical protein